MFDEGTMPYLFSHFIAYGLAKILALINVKAENASSSRQFQKKLLKTKKTKKEQFKEQAMISL